LSTVREVVAKAGLLEYDPLKLMSDVEALKKKVEEEGQRTREGLDGVQSSIDSFKKEMRDIFSR
jgi:hypothetical protein